MDGHYYGVQVQKPREIAFRVLRGGASSGAFVEHRLDAEVARNPLAANDRRLAQELVYGVVRWQATLDWLIAERTAGRPQKPDLQVLLRLGLYQLLWLDRVPDHAAVFETVALVHEAGYGPQAGFVNAVLRAYSEEKSATRQRLADLKQTRPALGWSHPDWLVERWVQRWGGEATARLLEWDNTPPKVLVRLNTLRVRPGTVIDYWRNEERVEYDFRHYDWVPENTAFELKSHPSLETMESFKRGWFYVQDPSTLLAAHLLDPQPGDSILDVCAAPGGKTTYLAQLLEDDCEIVAQDIDQSRLKLLQENCDRLGVGSVEPGLAPSAAAAPIEHPRRFDRVLVDAPCSNTGVLRRRVDLRWRIRPPEIQRLRQAQLALLRRGADQTKPGGVLVYSTCSLEPEENSGVVREFLAASSEFRLASERELLPFRDSVDGAYVARLERTGPAA